MIIVALRLAPVSARTVRLAFAFVWRLGQLFGRVAINLGHRNLFVTVVDVEYDRGVIGAGNEKVPCRDSGFFGVGAAKMQRSMPTFMVITSKYRRASNADDA